MPVTPMMLLLVMLMMFPLSALSKSVLLGAGTGLGSCAAPPYRARKVHWVYGCPPFASCCTELGFCRSQVGIWLFFKSNNKLFYFTKLKNEFCLLNCNDNFAKLSQAQLQLCWLAWLDLISLNPATHPRPHPPGKLYFSASANQIIIVEYS